MSIKAIIAVQQRKLDKQWHERYPKGMFRIAIMKRDRWAMKGFGYDIIAEVIMKRPTAHTRRSMGISIQKPLLQSQWPLTYCYNITAYDDFEAMRTRLQKLNFPMDVFGQLENWWKGRYK